jgi:dienelactone hydrolase
MAEESVRIPLRSGKSLEGDLALPGGPSGIVVFAHGSGSSRFSPRNRDVAAALRRERFGTLLMDLLMAEEERGEAAGGRLRFDIGLLAERLTAALGWLDSRPDTGPLPIGLFGASTGAGAALVTAAREPERVRAVVSRGGRPDLAGDALAGVKAASLLIVGGRDEAVLELNREALRQLPAPSRLEIVPGATHLFEEPGALEEVARLAAAWFSAHLG